jgi:hypothetical protein
MGYWALNVGIIDPLFCGPISTALINFSDRPRRIQIGDKFFRLLFFEHDGILDFHSEEESINRDIYLKELRTKSYADFAPSFLNIPSFDDKYYADKFWSIIWDGIWAKKTLSFVIFAGLIIFIWFQVSLRLDKFLAGKFDLIWSLFKHFQP